MLLYLALEPFWFAKQRVTVSPTKGNEFEDRLISGNSALNINTETGPVMLVMQTDYIPSKATLRNNKIVDNYGEK